MYPYLKVTISFRDFLFFFLLLSLGIYTFCEVKRNARVNRLHTAAQGLYVIIRITSIGVLLTHFEMLSLIGIHERSVSSTSELDSDPGILVLNVFFFFFSSRHKNITSLLLLQTQSQTRQSASKLNIRSCSIERIPDPY